MADQSGPLIEYLKKTGEQQCAFAARLAAACGYSITEPMVSRWCRGCTPSMAHRSKIAEITGGAVPVDAWPERQRGASVKAVETAGLRVGAAAGDLQRTIAEAAADGRIDEGEAVEIVKAARNVASVSDGICEVCSERN